MDIRKSINYLSKNPIRTGIFSDFDGTLTKIAPTPDRITIDAEVFDIFKRLKEKFSVVAIVSGRQASNIKSLLKIPKIIYVGNHGAEIIDDNHLYVFKKAKEAAPIIKKIKYSADSIGLNGVLVDYKKYTLGIHYRLSPCENKAKEKIKDILNDHDLRNLQINQGRKIIDIRPKGVNKGTAIEELIKKHHLKRVFYVGDDVTDLDAFKTLKRLRERSIIKACILGKLSKETENAIIKRETDFQVNTVEEVEEVLAKLIWSRR